MKQSKRRLYIHAQHGLGNRLRALASAASIAKACHRELIIVWEPDIHCDCHFHDLFIYEGAVLSNTDGLKLDAFDCYTYMETEPNSCKGKYITLHDNKDVYIRTAYVINNDFSNWSDENYFLRSLKPVESVCKMVNSVKKTNVGIHIRMEFAENKKNKSYDDESNWSAESHQKIKEWREKSHYKRFIKRVDQLLNNDLSLKIFLATDTSMVYKEFQKKYDGQLFFLEREIYNRSKEQLRFALADMILLSRNSYMLGSTWSSFSELAQRLSTTICKVEMSGVDF